jgi:16S rRNA G966 N2-methylase RsmD
MGLSVATALATEQRAIASVKIGKRFRHEVGDLASLILSIESVGLLHPIVVTGKGELIAGRRRLEACRRLGWQEIPAVTVNGVDARAAERDENVVRLALRPSDAVAVADHFRPQVEREAKARMFAGKPCGKFPEGRVRDRLGELAGLSARTLEKATAVVRAAEKTPKMYAAFVQKMDANGKVDAAYKALLKTQKAEQKAACPADLPAITDRYRLYAGELAEIGSQVADQSLDWIITDPPYSKEYLPAYRDLAAFATRALRPGGSLLAMVGQSYLPDVIAALSADLRYHWILAYLTPGGQAAQLWGRKVNTFWKPILWYTKGAYKGDWVGDVCRSDPNDNDKRFHDWGQSESGMADVIDRFTYPGQTICDPFMGAGTTGVVAVRLARLFVGMDRDEIAVQTAKERLAACRA